MDEREKRRLQDEEKHLLKCIDMKNVLMRLGIHLQKDRYSSNYRSPFRDDGRNGDFNIRQFSNGEWSALDFGDGYKRYDNINLVRTVLHRNHVQACEWLREQFHINVFEERRRTSGSERNNRNEQTTPSQPTPRTFEPTDLEPFPDDELTTDRARKPDIAETHQRQPKSNWNINQYKENDTAPAKKYLTDRTEDRRYVDSTIIDEIIRRDLLRYDKQRDMCVFVSPDKKTFQKRFCFDKPKGKNNWWIECVENKGIFVYSPNGFKDGGKADAIFVAESAIDAISFLNIAKMCVPPEHELWKEKRIYIGTGGPPSAYQISLIKEMMDANTKICCIADADEPGDKQWNIIKTVFSHATRILPTEKDFNKELEETVKGEDLMMTEEEEEEFNRLNAPDTIEKPNSGTDTDG